MTTFTMQDLNNLPTTPEEDEAMDALAKLGGGIDMKQMFEMMGGDLTGRVPVINISDGGRTVQYTTPQFSPEPQHAPTPQPTLCESTQTDLPSIINNICAQLQLLATVITQHQANTTPPEGNQSLQDCVSETLKQAGWFEDMVREAVNDMEFDDMIKDCVETEVEHYFAYSFDPTDHFDIDDAVTDAVDDKIDQAIENYMDNATLTLTRG
jgi:hypothetical protein